jgi:hypothetical protein
MLVAGTPGEASSAPGEASSAPGEVSSAPGAAGALERMRVKFPTAAIAVLRFAGTWRDLAAGQARLTDFVIPRELAARRTTDS